MYCWKAKRIIRLHESLPLRVVDIQSIRGGADDLSKLLRMGRAEIVTGRRASDDVAVAVGELTFNAVKTFYPSRVTNNHYDTDDVFNPFGGRLKI